MRKLGTIEYFPNTGEFSVALPSGETAWGTFQEDLVSVEDSKPGDELVAILDKYPKEEERLYSELRKLT